MTVNQLNLTLEKAVKLMLLAILFIVPLVFYIRTHDVFEINKITAFQILLLPAFAALLVHKVVNHNWRWRPSPLWAPVAAVGLTSLLSTLVSNNSLTSVLGVYEDYEGIITIAAYLMLWVLVHQTTTTFQHVKKYLYMVVIAGTLATAYGIAQNYGIDFIRWNPTTYSAARMFGSLGNPNFLAAYGLMTLPVAWMFFIINQRVSSKLLFLMMTVTMAVAIFFTKSRGAVYGLAVEMLVFAAYLVYDYLHSGRLVQENKRWLVVFAVMACLTLLAPQVRQTVKTTIGRTLNTLNVSEIKMTPRLYIWKSALKMIKDKPLLGSGLDTFQITFPKYRLPLYWQLEWNGTPEKAHNFFLQIGATTGLLGLGAWLWLLITYFAIVVRQLRRLEGTRRHLAVAIALAQLGFLVQDQFNFTVVAYGSLFWFFLGLGPTLSRQEEPVRLNPDVTLTPQSWPAKQWAAVAGIGVLSVAAVFWSLRLWSADIFFKRGIIFMTQGMVEQAVPELRRAVAINPWREIYWVKEGIALEEMAKRASDKLPYLREAETIHRHTLAMNPLNGYDYNNLGRVYKYWGEVLDKKKLQAAEKACRQAVDLDPYNAYFNLDLASILISLRQWGQVEKTAQHLIELFPDFAMPYAYLGYVGLMENNMEKAKKNLTLASEKNWRGDIPTRASTMSNLGIVRVRFNELEGALQAFDECLSLQPLNIEARYNKGLVLERLGRSALAVEEYRTIISEAPHYHRVAELQQRIARLEGGKP